MNVEPTGLVPYKHQKTKPICGIQANNIVGHQVNSNNSKLSARKLKTAMKTKE